jgi:hypothetical protein
MGVDEVDFKEVQVYLDKILIDAIKAIEEYCVHDMEAIEEYCVHDMETMVDISAKTNRFERRHVNEKWKESRYTRKRNNNTEYF